jgi:GT2 family glycosyltransferase
LSLCVSVVIVSRDRAQALGRVLKALRFQTYPEFEVVVVSDTPVTDAVHVSFDAANISRARNLGIAQARGDVIAFCDDDAVPEPTWLAQLVTAFDDPSVGAAGGLVIGRNGVSVQWGAVMVDRSGADHPALSQSAHVVAPQGDMALKTHGTNCGFRRDALRDVGGFDAGFAYYLDEADVNWRLNRAGWAAAYVPEARVQHGFAPSAQRHANRRPKTLYDVGASTRLFQRKHDAGADVDLAWARLEAAQRARLVGMMTYGLIEPRDIVPLMGSLRDGFDAGETQESAVEPVGTSAGADALRRYETTKQAHVYLKARLYNRRKVLGEARALAAARVPCTVIEVLPSMRMTTVRFKDAGFWHHRVGQFGRTERSDCLYRPRWSWTAFARERARVAGFR